MDELEEIPAAYKIFKSSAFAIDERMNEGPDWNFTLVHGDFKDANIFSGKNEQGEWICSAVDFQYCGKGYGAKDLVMLVVSSVSTKVFDELGGEDGLLAIYSKELERNLVAMGILSLHEIGQILNVKVLKMQYELALVDYVRFMAG
jgi:Ser/Thr protein kinase RdoA (MazF antagonist)